jgi:glutathione S-transferase
MTILVLGGGVSPFGRKVRVALWEKGVDFQHEQVNPFTPPPNYRDISPLGKIPALKDGDRTLCDSSVICAYLERRFPTPPLYPSDAYEYARALWFEEYMDGGVAPAVLPKTFLPLVVRPLMSGGPPSPEAEEIAQKTWLDAGTPLFEYLERQLGDGEFFVGDRLTVADIAVGSVLLNARYAGFAPERKKFPRLRAFLERVWARPSFKRAIDEEMPVFGRRAERIAD